MTLLRRREGLLGDALGGDRGRTSIMRTLFAPLLMVFGFILVIGYALLFFQVPDPRNLSNAQIVHLALNLLCIYVVGATSVRLRGRLDQKVSWAILVSILVYGSFSFLILGGRWFFSRPVLLTSFLVSLSVGTLLVLIRHRTSGPRVAIIGSIMGDESPGRSLGEVVTDPSGDLRTYDIILVAFDGSLSTEWARTLSHALLSGCKVRHIGEYMEEMRGAVSLEHFDVDQISHTHINSYRFMKRVLDLVLVAFILPVSLPLVVLGALWVLLSMGRPVFFVQERAGLGGGAFRMWKLRTMRMALPGEERLAAVPGDPRVTTAGRILRRFRVDELPQLWNVIKGDMSLIGPRPEALAFHDEYMLTLPKYAYRSLVRPGITGWAQVSTPPSANADEARRKLAYDLFYVKHLSLFLDLEITFKTFWTITHGAGVR